MLNEQWDVLLTISKCGKRNRENVQAEVEISAKGLLIDHLVEMKIGRRNDSRVYRSGTVAPHPFELLLLKDTQQFRLEFQRKIANLIQKQRSTVGCLKTSYSLRDSASESAFFMAEQFAFK